MIFRRTVAQFRLLANASAVGRTVEFVGLCKAIRTSTNTSRDVAKTVRSSSANAKRNCAASQHEPVAPSGADVNPKEIVVAPSQTVMARF